ncbi:MAG TPA: ATP-binding protein, partial [Armatimonadota bacterium]|nr:ATP-binding protein [Armatimonadota bacterium]
RVAAGIAHEVKNPLVAVRTFAELLPEQYEDPEFRDGFSKLVLQEVDRIDGLIAQLLNYARPKPPKLEPVDLNKLIQETLQLVNYQFTRQQILIQNKLSTGLPLIMADVSQIRQVILNIILNATQVMPDGGSLRLTTRVPWATPKHDAASYLLPTAEMVEVEIANSGPQIPQDQREQLFEPFFSTRSNGTGLGLSICKRIITEHHGQIWVSTTEDGLTAFLLRLPTTTSQAPEGTQGSPRESLKK